MVEEVVAGNIFISQRNPFFISLDQQNARYCTMQNSYDRNHQSASLHIVQSFSFSVRFLTNDTPVTGSLAVYKQNMKEAK